MKGLGIMQKLRKFRNQLKRNWYSMQKPKPRSKNYEFEHTICALLRNEADILEEWVLFHLAVGVDHFVLWDDHSSDHSRKVLRPYEEAGLVEWREFFADRYTVKRQVETYNQGIKLLRGRSRWVWFLDPDEFLVPVKGDNIREIMSHHAREKEIGAVCVNWIFFGTSGVQKLKDNEWYIQKLLQRAPLDWQNHRTVKSGLQPESTAAFIGQPHHPVLYHNRKLIYPNGDAFTGKKIETSLLRLHHYWHRTEEFYRDEKISRKEYMSGKMRGPKAAALHHRKHNEVFDDTILRFLPRMRELRARYTGGAKRTTS